MSYDLEIWSVQPVDLSDPNRSPSKNGTWTRTGRGWNLEVGPSNQVSAEDIPDDVANLLPGIAFVTELNLSPITAADNARRILTRLAMQLATAAHGVIFDPQTDIITTARGVRRLASLGPSESASVITLSWWFISGALIDRRVADLVHVLESTLPEALPKRYGSYEPPQHLYADTGRDHFVSFFRYIKTLVVWYPQPPIAGVKVSIPPYVGGSRAGFRCGYLAIEVDVDALIQPGWAVGLARAWKQISLTVQPFYGDVRTLRGFKRRRGRYWINSGTEHHPVCSWWWAGIPHGPVHAAVLGNPYRQFWPSFCEKAETSGDVSFVSTNEWLADTDVFAEIGPPPADIAQLRPEAASPNNQRKYPTNWPFHTPRTD